jgi:hypothetical protein
MALYNPNETGVWTMVDKRHDDLTVRLHVSLTLAQEHLETIDIEMLENLNIIISNNAPAWVQLAAFSTVFKSLGKEENIVNK